MDECAFHFIQKTVSIHLNYPLGEIVCVVLLLFSGILLFPRSLENTDTNKTSKIKKNVGMDTRVPDGPLWLSH